MDHIIREAKGPLPPTWHPGMPLPKEYKQKCVKKLPDFEEETYKDVAHRLFRGGRLKNVA